MNSWQALPSQVDDSDGDIPSMAETRFEFKPISISAFNADIALLLAKLRLYILEPLASANPTIRIGNCASLIFLTICCASSSRSRSIEKSFNVKNLVSNTSEECLCKKSRFSACIGLLFIGNSGGVDLLVMGGELKKVNRSKTASNPNDKSKMMV